MSRRHDARDVWHVDTRYSVRDLCGVVALVSVVGWANVATS